MRLGMDICKCLVSKQTNMGNFHPLEVMGHAGLTRFQVSKILNKINWRVKG